MRELLRSYNPMLLFFLTVHGWLGACCLSRLKEASPSNKAKKTSLSLYMTPPSCSPLSAFTTHVKAGTYILNADLKVGVLYLCGNLIYGVANLTWSLRWQNTERLNLSAS